ncbi:valine--tRNA ligase [Candidatus Woesearchaeota archaeon]|jgi:valyl-tRNA synthetase|nr:valine--tRNA ligase [Candidatus Woesearchaeota archaeon]
MELGKKYQAKETEEKITKFWDEQKVFKFNPNSKKPVFSIDTPPPYASAGHLHVGHGLSYTQFEIFARVKRLLGFEVYFPPGFDDNGLPTEKYVEEKLGIKKSETNRSDFRKICLEESRKVEEVYADKVFKKLGHSYDWDLLYTTISPDSQKVAQTAFVKLVKKGDCYRNEEPTIWCPFHETALAQAEVEDLNRNTKMNRIHFDLENGEKIEIATTRPEFLPACVGVFVNPEDKRYTELVGKNAIVPLFNLKVPIKSDKDVDPEFGSGIMMVCTFGDTADVEKWKRLNLDLRIVVTKEGKLNDNCGKYAGLKLADARAEIIQDLKTSGHFIGDDSLAQTVGSCWRCNTPVEYVVTKQWFIKTIKYKEDLIKRSKEINWHPEFMRTRFENWTENLGWDWIISRQRYYGVPMPVWYCEDCDEVIIAEESELPIDPNETQKNCPKCNKVATPETDVFDTWMTSSNSPEVASQWTKNPEIYKKIAPMSLRPQSHDIIRTWAFYTILKSHLLFDRIPWEDITINTFVLDSKGRGMSKSKGNAVWVDAIIDKYNVDAFRFWVGGASLGSDLPFNEQELVAGQKFLTKLWNASRFVFMQLKDYNPKTDKPDDSKLLPIDKWAIQNTKKMLDSVKKHYESYNIPAAKREAEKFFWHFFCDNYLEIVKDRVYKGTGNDKRSGQHALYEVLISTLKVFAPITCFITEEIYLAYFNEFEPTNSIHISQWPTLQVTHDDNIEEIGSLFLDILSKIRQEKTNNQKSMKTEVILTLEKEKIEKLNSVLNDFKSVTKAIEIKEGEFKIELVEEEKKEE